MKPPSFTLPAVVTLALGLAATVAIFTLLDTIVLRPLPFPNAERLVALSSPMPKLNDTWGIARHQLFYYKTNARAIEEMGLYRTGEATLTGDGSTSFAERVKSATVTAGIFDVLGIVPTMYRTKTIEHSENLKQLREQFGALVWNPIPQRTIWAEAAAIRRPVFSFAPESLAARDAWELVNRVQEGLARVG